MITQLNVQSNYKQLIEEIGNKRFCELKAFCSSIMCENDNKGSRKLGVYKNVNKHLVDCPDCGHALYWTTDESVHGY